MTQPFIPPARPLIGEEEIDAVAAVMRTGMIALERGKYTIDEDTKEKGEFNYGKDVL